MITFMGHCRQLSVTWEFSNFQIPIWKSKLESTSDACLLLANKQMYACVSFIQQSIRAKLVNILQFFSIIFLSWPQYSYIKDYMQDYIY